MSRAAEETWIFDRSASFVKGLRCVQHNHGDPVTSLLHPAPSLHDSSDLGSDLCGRGGVRRSGLKHYCLLKGRRTLSHESPWHRLFRRHTRTANTAIRVEASQTDIRRCLSRLPADRVRCVGLSGSYELPLKRPAEPGTPADLTPERLGSTCLQAKRPLSQDAHSHYSRFDGSTGRTASVSCAQNSSPRSRSPPQKCPRIDNGSCDFAKTGKTDSSGNRLAVTECTFDRRSSIRQLILRTHARLTSTPYQWLSSVASLSRLLSMAIQQLQRSECSFDNRL